MSKVKDGLLALPKTVKALWAVEEYLDNLADVQDSPDGGQEPNKAMQLLSLVQDAFEEMGV
jgi:hypothetical protein